MAQRYRIDQLAEFFRDEHIAIVGNGPSVVRINSDGRRTAPVFDVTQETKGHLWTVNGGWFYHPAAVLGFQMDDLKGPAMAEHPNSDWYTSLSRDAKIPIITTTEYEDFPSTVAFPLEDALRYFYPRTYYAESISYMLQLAIMFGVGKIDLLGVDYQMSALTTCKKCGERQEHPHLGVRPQERACTEYWIGQAEARGIECNVLTTASCILKPTYDWEEGYYLPGFYGYASDRFPLQWSGNPGLMNIQVSGKAQNGKWWAGIPNLWRIHGMGENGPI